MPKSKDRKEIAADGKEIKCNPKERTARRK